MWVLKMIWFYYLDLIYLVCSGEASELTQGGDRNQLDFSRGSK